MHVGHDVCYVRAGAFPNPDTLSVRPEYARLFADCPPVITHTTHGPRLTFFFYKLAGFFATSAARTFVCTTAAGSGGTLFTEATR